MMGGLTAEEMGVAEWVAKNDKHAGATTNTLSHAQNLYLSVRGNQDVVAVVGIPAKFYPPLEAFEKNLMIAILDECGLILERRSCSLKAGGGAGNPSRTASGQPSAGDFP